MQTIYACFIGYIVQAIVNNFVPLLFVTFQNNYHISLEQITFLITLNFIIQLFVDLLSAFFIDKIGYRISILIAHILTVGGMWALFCYQPHFSGFSEYRTGKSSHLCGLSSQYLTLSSSEVHQSTPFTKKVNRDFLSENCAHLKSSGC